MIKAGRIPISVIVLTKNEALVIGRTVERLACFDQVIVVDSCSLDSTSAIAAEAGAEVVNFEWNGQYPKKKQWALQLSHIRNSWVLFVDADEYPSAALLEELSDRVPELERHLHASYDIELEYYFAGNLLKHGHRVMKRALVDKRRCQFPVIDDLGVAMMWEVEGHYQPVSRGSVGRLHGHLIHDDVDPLFDYFSRHNRYSDWEAYLRLNPGTRHAVQDGRTRQGRVFDAIPFKPLAFFVYSYALRGGFLDGRPGFDYAIALSFYYWQIEVKRRAMAATVAPAAVGNTRSSGEAL